MLMRQFRAVVFGRALGPWREERHEALEDAIAAGEAYRDRYDNDRIYVSAWVKILDREVRIEPS